MTINKILIGVDDSKYADHAAAYGFDLARSLGAEVGLVNIVEPVVMPSTRTDTALGMPMINTIDPVNVELFKVEDSVADSIIDRTINNYGSGLTVVHFKEYGSSGDGIIDCAKNFNANLIVIGTHSRTGLDRLLTGSVAEHVVRHSKIPVLVVPFLEG